MSTAGSSAAPSLKQHSREVRVKACQSLDVAVGENQALRDQIAGGVASLRAGNSKDGPAFRAYQHFQKLSFSCDEDAVDAHAMSRHTFECLLSRWAKGYFDGTNRECVRRSFRAPGLSAAQKQELAHLLGTPKQGAEGTHVWRDLDDALAHHPQRDRIAELVAAAGKPHAALVRELLHHNPRLKICVVDRVSKLAPRTQSAREDLAVVWAGKVPWLEIEDGKLARPWSGNFGEGDVGVKRWEKPWPIYRNFTFLIDASTMDDQDSPAKVPQKGFVDPLRVFRPEETRPGHSGTAAHKVTYYIITCARLGLVLGPEFMYHGCTPTRNSRDIGRDRKAGIEAPELHIPEFPHWCALLVAQLSPATNKVACWQHKLRALTCWCRFNKMTPEQKAWRERSYGYPILPPRYATVSPSLLNNFTWCSSPLIPFLSASVLRQYSKDCVYTTLFSASKRNRSKSRTHTPLSLKCKRSMDTLLALSS